MFDLPVKTKEEIREYNRFRKFLVKSGFMMMQNSIYSKIALNAVSADSIVSSIKQNKPKGGLVQVLKITEKQYSRMEYIIGQKTSDVIDSDERIVVL